MHKKKVQISCHGSFNALYIPEMISYDFKKVNMDFIHLSHAKILNNYATCDDNLS